MPAVNPESCADKPPTQKDLNGKAVGQALAVPKAVGRKVSFQNAGGRPAVGHVIS